MKKEFFQEIEIPEGVEVEVKQNLSTVEIKVKGEKGEFLREFFVGKVKVENKKGRIIVGSKVATKTEKKTANTLTAHLKNMFTGVKDGFEYALKVCSSHFPMTVSMEGNKAVVKNFLGEKTPREVKIPENVEVKIEKDIIKVNSANKELAGQTAAEFEKSTKIPLKDRRVFQDGIFITNKAGKEI